MDLCQLRNLISELIHDTEFVGRSYFAGGCVRDFILGRITEDFDISVELPEGGIRLANFLAKKLKTRPPVVYTQFGTAMLKYGRHKLEFIMTRQESYRPPSRNPKVSFGSLEQDIQRRDFTINAMLLNITSGLLVDLAQRGQKDIQERIIRCVVNPDRTFREDPLRILRAIRFAHSLNFGIESDTKHSLIANAQAIRTLAPERIASEFGKILLVPGATNAIRAMAEYGILKHILPELDALRGLKQNHYHHLDAFDHTLAVFANSPIKALPRWAALLHDIGKRQCYSQKGDGKIHFYGHEKVSAEMAPKVLIRFGLSVADQKRIQTAIARHMLFKNTGEHGEKLGNYKLRKLCHQLSEQELKLLLDLVHADNLSHAPAYCLPHQIPALRERIKAIRAEHYSFPLTGNDLILAFAIESSPLVGKLLARALDYWCDNPDLSRDELLELIRKHI